MYKPIGIAALAAALAFGPIAFAGDLAVVSRVEPEFPHEATAIGAEQGRVHARVTIEASGDVEHVEILNASPRRVFDRAVIRALAQWRFNPGAQGRSYEVDIDFKR